MVSFVISLGEAFGVGIGGVVFQNQWTRHVEALNTLPEPVVTYQEAEQAGELIKVFPLAVQMVYRVIMADVIATLFIVLAAFSGFAFVVSLGSRNLSMDRETKSSQQFKEKEIMNRSEL